MLSSIGIRNSKLQVLIVTAVLFLLCLGTYGSSALAAPDNDGFVVIPPNTAPSLSTTGLIAVGINLASNLQENPVSTPAEEVPETSETAPLQEENPSSDSQTSAVTVTATSTEPAGTEGSASVGLTDSVLVSAYSLLGTPYSYGSTGPSAFDCSGFVQYVYKANGITLPRIACDQANVGDSISKSDLIPGDLVFFGYYGSGSIHHVGIYVGNDQFIHASSGNTHAVTVSSLSSSYYANNFKWAKRVIN